MLSFLEFFGVIGNAIGAVGKWLLSNPVVLAIVAAGLVLAYIVISKNDKIAELTKEINDPKTGWVARYDASEKNNETLKANNAALTASLNAQSASIASLAVQGQQSSIKFDKLLAAQAATRSKLGQQLTILAAAKPGADKCQSATDLVRSMTQ